MHEYFRRCAFPDAASVQAILAALEAHDGLTARDLEAVVNLRAGQIRQTLKFLAVETPAPVFREDGRWRRSPAPYRMDRARIERLIRQRWSEWQEMQRYVDTDGCRMVFLTDALGDASPRACGKCDACLGEPVVASSLEDSQTLTAELFPEPVGDPAVLSGAGSGRCLQGLWFHGSSAPGAASREGPRPVLAAR